MSQTQARLERRARTLLRAYPADYRRDRAEEVIGTLLEATPAGRSFPSARDTRALIAGGLRARAARNRRLSATASLRLALLLGISIFLGFSVTYRLAGPTGGRGGVHWLPMAVGILSVAAALAPWLGRRTIATAIVLPAAALTAYKVLGDPYWLSDGSGAWLTGILIAMGALAALSGGPWRLPRSWLWLPCVLPAALAAGRLLLPSGAGNYIFTNVYLPEYAVLLLAAVVACWLVTDARPAFGLVAAVLLTLLLGDLTSLPDILRSPGIVIVMIALLPLAIAVAIMLLLAWLLRRQAAPGQRPLPGP